MSHALRKPMFCIYAKTKALISFAVTVKLISAFVFATQIVQFLCFLNPKFPASSHLLCLYSSVCVRPVPKPNYWISHDAVHMFYGNFSFHIYICFIHNICSYGKVQFTGPTFFILKVSTKRQFSSCLYIVANMYTSHCLGKFKFTTFVSMANFILHHLFSWKFQFILPFVSMANFSLHHLFPWKFQFTTFVSMANFSLHHLFPWQIHFSLHRLFPWQPVHPLHRCYSRLPTILTYGPQSPTNKNPLETHCLQGSQGNNCHGYLE